MVVVYLCLAGGSITMASVLVSCEYISDTALQPSLMFVR